MPLALAVAFSAMLHLAALVAPGWDLGGGEEPEAAPLEAHLPPPKAAPRPAPKALPRAARKRTEPAVATAAPAAVPSPGAAPAEAVADSAAAPGELSVPVGEPAVATAPAAPPWPRRGKLHYVVTYGEDAFVIGETSHEWQVDGARYAIRSAAEPKGLAAMFGKARTQESVGEVTDAGLRPDEFRDQRAGRDAETASFDWTANQLVFSSGRRDGGLVPGTQDLISVFYQLAWLAPRRDVDLPVATANRLGRWRFEWLGEEELGLALGTLTTLHLRTRADGDTTEVWLAPAHGGLPVRIRHVDRKGLIFEQSADNLELN